MKRVRYPRVQRRKVCRKVERSWSKYSRSRWRLNSRNESSDCSNVSNLSSRTH